MMTERHQNYGHKWLNFLKIAQITAAGSSTNMLKPTRCHQKKTQFEMQSDAACTHIYFVRTLLKCSQATCKVFTYFPVNFVRYPFFPFSIFTCRLQLLSFILAYFSTSQACNFYCAVLFLLAFCVAFVTHFLCFHVSFHLRHSAAVPLYIVYIFRNSSSFTCHFLYRNSAYRTYEKF